jgi:hypothetical protein
VEIALGIWRLAPALGNWHLASGARLLALQWQLALGISHLATGPWLQAHGNWHLASHLATGPWHLAQGNWHFTWQLALGIWHKATGTCPPLFHGGETSVSISVLQAGGGVPHQPFCESTSFLTRVDSSRLESRFSKTRGTRRYLNALIVRGQVALT